MVRFADRLRFLRAQQNMTQPELAISLGVIKQTISKWEKGERFPDEDTLIKIADFFGVTRGNLLGDNEDYTSVDILNYNYLSKLLDQLHDDGLISKDDVPEVAMRSIAEMIKLDLSKQNKK